MFYITCCYLQANSKKLIFFINLADNADQANSKKLIFFINLADNADHANHADHADHADLYILKVPCLCAIGLNCVVTFTVRRY